MTREEDDMEQKASNKKKKNQNKFTEVCFHDSLILYALPLKKKGNGNDYL
jgi:hypothetical protein